MDEHRNLSADTLNQEELVLLVFDFAHRLLVHHTLWFREVEHQLGFKRALRVMDRAWEKTRRNLVQRLSLTCGFAETEGVPDYLRQLPRSQALALLDDLAKSWLAQDGLWFQAVEKDYGMQEAKRCNDSTWAYFSPYEAHAVKKFLHLPDHPGLDGLEKALTFRLYSRLNHQRLYRRDDALILEMRGCRVQCARARKNMADYPCKSAGLVEYGRFAENIDSRIQTECIACPPDEHPDEWFCAWKFILPEP